MQYDQEMKEWFESRPEPVKELIRKYPPGKYLVIESAPYGVTCSGSEIKLFGWNEDGEVHVMIKAEDKLPEALEHERKKALEHGRTEEEIKNIHTSDIRAVIDPKWLSPLEVEQIPEDWK